MDDRKHFTAAEVEKLLTATKGTRNEARDRCLLLLLKRTRTCCATLVASPWPTRALTRG